MYQIICYNLIWNVIPKGGNTTFRFYNVVSNLISILYYSTIGKDLSHSKSSKEFDTCFDISI